MKGFVRIIHGIQNTGRGRLRAQICLLPRCTPWTSRKRRAASSAFAFNKGCPIQPLHLEFQPDHFSCRPAFLLRESHFAYYRDSCPHRKPWWPIKMFSWKLPLARPIGTKMRTQTPASGDLRICWLHSLVEPVQQKKKKLQEVPAMEESPPTFSVLLLGGQSGCLSKYWRKIPSCFWQREGKKNHFRISRAFCSF